MSSLPPVTKKHRVLPNTLESSNLKKEELCQSLRNKQVKERFLNVKQNLLETITSSSLKSFINELDAEHTRFIKELQSTTIRIHDLQSPLTIPSYPCTINSTPENFRRYKIDLKNKLEILRENNEILRNDLNHAQNEKLSKHAVKNLVTVAKIEQSGSASSLIPHKLLKKKKLLHGKDVLDITQLKRLLNELIYKITILKTNLGRTNLEYESLKLTLQKKDNEREIMFNRYENNCAVYNRLAMQIENLQREFQSLNFDLSFSKTLSILLNQHGYQDTDPFQHYIREGLLDSDEPADRAIVDDFINYIQQFERLFTAGDYENAATYAANSPHGALRTYEVLKRFRSADTADQKFGCLKLFCQKVMDTTALETDVLSPKLSMEIIKCGVEGRNLLLTKHWLCNKAITFSIPLGDFFLKCCECKNKCTCQFTPLALLVFTRLNEFEKCLLCHDMMEIVQSKKDIDGLSLFERMPSCKLFHILSARVLPQLSLPFAVGVFLDRCMFTDIISLLTHVLEDGLQEVSLMDCLYAETRSDNMGDDKWIQVLHLCDVYKEYKLLEELFSCLITRSVLENATLYCLTDYFG